MSPQSRTGEPAFFWQGLLIVLPVLLLAGLGLVSLRQDLRLAEQDAQQRGQELLQQIFSTSRQQIGPQLAALASLAQDSYQAGTGRSAWPGSDEAKEFEAKRPALQARLAEWSGAYPQLSAEKVLLPPALLSTDGELVWPSGWKTAPLPPPWLAELALDQKAAWDSAWTMEASGKSRSDLTNAWHQFLLTHPSSEAAANAEFALARLSSNSNAIAPLVYAIGSATNGSRQIRTDSGLPLGAAACGVALRLSEAGLNEPLFACLQAQVQQPSLLTPYFLAEAERRAHSSPAPVRDAVRALCDQWDQQERLRELAQAAGERLKSDPEPSNLFWIDALSNRWLVLNTADARTTNGHRVCWFFLKSQVSRVLEDSIRNSGVAIPAYFSVDARFAGEQIRGAPGRNGASESTSARLLAQASGALLQTASARWTPNSGSSPGPADKLADSMTGAPQASLALNLYLTDAPLLYERQTQRTLWFAALILAVALIAVIGFIRARRAFLREHQLNELKTNFVSSVSHELRAPIASVRLMAESLERGKVQDPAKQREYFGFMVQECGRLSSLISNVLDFSRIEQGRKEYEFEPTDLRALVHHTVEFMQTYAAERAVKLVLSETQADSSAPPACAGSTAAPGNAVLLDGRAIQQALVNLIDNALKHSPKGSTVTVGLRLPFSSVNHSIEDPLSPPSDSRLALWVEDHGPGIPASEHARIFERFYRLGSELRRETQGVGIGLSIVKHIVEAHGGQVRVESELGKGSRFTIELSGLQSGGPGATRLNDSFSNP
jgi:signal transduction histidine kinase